jgi:ligand-binding SRPBCC domain-containing protein
MPVIELTTIINAPVERCFDLARSIDLHQQTSSHTGEKAIAGVTSGLISKGETVTWKAKHFGVVQKLTSVISEMDVPHSFEDSMIQGAFKSIRHQHTFEFNDGKTVMKDIFVFESPYGILGSLFNRLVLTDYMKRFLEERNQQIKEIAETEEWKKYLKG